MSISIRPLERADVVAYMQLTKRIDAETSFLSSDPNDPKISIPQMLSVVTAKRQLFLLAETEEGELVGHLGAFWRRGKGQRVKHTVHVGLGVLKSHWGQGIGTAMFEALEDWAKEQGIVRLELDVMTHNERGVALYKKMGFEIEGTKRCSIIIDGTCIDEYMMSKILK